VTVSVTAHSDGVDALHAGMLAPRRCSHSFGSGALCGRFRTKAEEGVADHRASFLDQVEVEIDALERPRELQAFEYVVAVGIGPEAHRGHGNIRPSRCTLADAQPRLIRFQEDAGFGKAAIAFRKASSPYRDR